MQRNPEDVRREVDRIDESIHDLIMRRTEVVAQLGEANLANYAGYLRPGRHAEIVRRLISRHQGKFPRANLVRVWNEMLGALLSIHGRFSLAVYMPERGAGFLELARDQFGSYASATVLRSVGQVVRAVADGHATVGILPMPDRDDIEPWWISLMPESHGIPRIIGRLPFLGPGPGRGDGVEAMAIARMPQDPTGYDRTLIAVETAADVSRARLRSALGAAGLEPTQLTATQYGDDFWLHLVELTGYVPSDDERVLRLLDKREPVKRVVSLGGYAVPLRPDELTD
jgi:chorismate mutase